MWPNVRKNLFTNFMSPVSFYSPWNYPDVFMGCRKWPMAWCGLTLTITWYWVQYPEGYLEAQTKNEAAKQAAKNEKNGKRKLSDDGDSSQLEDSKFDKQVRITNLLIIFYNIFIVLGTSICTGSSRWISVFHFLHVLDMLADSYFNRELRF